MQSSPIGISLGLASAATWGGADFSGGLVSKKTNVFGTVAIAHGLGFAIYLTAVLLRGETLPAVPQLGLGVGAGIIGGLGLVALYRGLAVGNMGAVAPVSAVVCAALPALFGALTEGRPQLVQSIGFVFALAGVWLVSQPGGSPQGRRGLALGLLAGVGFGLFLIMLPRAGTVSILGALCAARAGSFAFLVALILFTRQRWQPQPPHLPWIAAAGVFDAVGNILFVFATHFGRLAVSAVLASLYPAITVILARLILKEELTRVQTAGMWLALVAIAMIAW